jgi:hypothetical protein
MPVIRAATRPLIANSRPAITTDAHHTHEGDGSVHGPMHSNNVYPIATANRPASHNPVTAMIAQITVEPVSSDSVDACMRKR